MPRHNHKRKRRGQWENGYAPRARKGLKRRDLGGSQSGEHFAEADRRMREAEERAA